MTSNLTYIEETRKKLTPSRKVKIGVGIGLVAVGYVLHRRKLDAVITLSQAAVQDTMWSSFDEGVRYGLELAKDVGLEAAEALKSGKNYAFGAFDKAS